MCQYLFAAFSLKQSADEGVTHEQMNYIADWERFLLMVARQEMEHLGLVCNLLTAVGAAPYLAHPNFPYRTTLFSHAMSLEAFSEATIKKFICFERPETIEPEDAFCNEPLAVHLTVLKDVSPVPVPYKTVGELYDAIVDGFAELTKRGVKLIIGPGSAQVTGTQLNTDFVRRGGQGGGYDIFMVPVTDIESAHRVLDRIIEQGESARNHGESSHFETFLRILKQFQKLQQDDPDFQPARPVVPNPVLYPDGTPHQTAITSQNGRGVLDLLNGAYEVLLLLLIRFFAHSDETTVEIAQLQAAAFFPFMTMVIRPITEVLMSLPAFDGGGPERAGPNFEFYRNVNYLPHRRAAWQVLYERMVELTETCQALSKQPEMPPRLGYIAESLKLITMRFQSLLHL
ncbi:Violacein biosynthesis protein VioB [Acidisarcina polymorpha]|uniref:Violacein biosynthesis protein VioB n=2 Tax=Acidisarcina polymorpha TaxID=2211140 RepID=A0A2Z5G6T9_9BACT|nr:ferritin-like domain-containing protein [Acidisarcina polymorpha]AXC14811.1 Violacein biosynthesis protein VioB [Acidisarcina polymorpha]